MKKIVLIFVFILVNFLFAGGPLSTFNGKVVRYKSDTVKYHLDRGPFGIFTNLQARTLANASFKVWEDVQTATITFNHTDADTLPVDVNGTNYLQYTTLTSVKIDGINPIIFDSDGAITNALFGAGAANSVIGFAWTEDIDNDGFYDEGEAVMNGKFAAGTANSFTYDEWKSTFVHEFGHFLGLDHTQINGEFVNEATKTVYIPTMYPTSTINDVPLGDLNPDDIAAISLVYPAPSFTTTTGSISGSVVRASGAVVRGANVIAIGTGSDSLMNRISTVTDYFEQNNGNFKLSGLTAGSYYVRIEPIDMDFTEGSSVGPYSYDLSGLSFSNPVIKEYYNGANESGDPLVDQPNERTSVSVTAGNSTTGINVIANNKSSTNTALLSVEFTGAPGSLITNNGWIQSGTVATNPITVVQPGLLFTGFASSGNSALLNTNGQDVYRSFTAVSEDALYLSFLISVDTAKTGDYFIALSPFTSQTNYFARVHIKSSGNGYLLGISKQAETSGGAAYGSTVMQLKTSYLVIVKYEFVSGVTTNDKISVFAFSSILPASEPATPEIGPYTNSGRTDATDLGTVTLRQGSASAAPYLRIGKIYVSTGWGTGITSVLDDEHIIPSSIALHQNYPNPFNPTTTISYSLTTRDNVRLKVFDLLGREISTLVNETQNAGTYQIRFNGSQLSSGIYLYQLRSGQSVLTRKLTLLK